jgi:hypothetical protein
LEGTNVGEREEGRVEKQNRERVGGTFAQPVGENFSESRVGRRDDFETDTGQGEEVSDPEGGSVVTGRNRDSFSSPLSLQIEMRAND